MATRLGLVCILVAGIAGQTGQQSGAPPPPTPPPTIAVPQATTPQPEAIDQLANGAITGLVVDGTTGAPVANAIVFITPTIRRAGATQTRQLTDDKGRYAFVNLPADPGYTISASKFGFLDGGFGRDAAPSDPLRQVVIKTDEWIPNVRVPIWKPGSISGMVRDENGEPVVGVFVRALVRYRMQGRDDIAAGPMTLTDDRGAYRIAGLSPGRYIIQVPSVQASAPMGAVFASVGPMAPDGAIDVDDTMRLVIGRYPLPPPPANGRPMAYPIALHPASTTVVQAAAIELKYADDRQNVDIALTPVPAARVSGTVEGPPNAFTFLTLRLLPAGLENLGNGSETATALVNADGTFTFLNVPAGAYTIDAPLTMSELFIGGSNPSSSRFPMPPGRTGWSRTSDSIETVPGLSFTTTDFRGGEAANYSGRSSITVGASDISGVVVRLKPNATMSGRIVMENDPQKPAPTTPLRFAMTADPASGEAYLGMPRAPYRADTPLEFAISGIMPAAYWLRAQGNPAWLAKSIIWKGVDYTTTPFDAAGADDISGVVVTMTNAVPELSGSVRGTENLKPDECMVIAFPAERSLWRNTGLWPVRMKTVPVGSTGTYRLTTLPAGSYLVAAISRSHRLDWRDPAFLEQVDRVASRVTLTWGGKTSQDLSVAVIK